MRPLKPLILLMALAAAAIFWSGHSQLISGTSGNTSVPTVGAEAGRPAFLPTEARATLQRIASGGPFTHRQDGAVFGNYEKQLPQEPRGYYREYTVETPGTDTRGVRRIITGGTPPDVYYYTNDHYRSFRVFKVSQ